MRLSLRSYPHPVLGNRDDVPGAAFQAAMDMTTDKQQVYLSVDVKCSSNSINKFIKDDSAEIVLHVECSNTMYRRVYGFNQLQHRISIPVDNLNDSVEVNVFVVAKRSLSSYRLDGAHRDYGSTAFDIQRGDILAIAEGQVFHVESSFDSLSRIGSIMQITESVKDGDQPMEITTEGDKILIHLSKSDFADYKLLKTNEGVVGPLTTTIVLPVLIEVVQMIKNENPEEDDDRKWVRVLKRRIESLGLKTDSSALSIAQILLELPVKRALAASKMIAEGNG